MPEKLKRRKNNKNKRKNKNVRVDSSINNITSNNNTSVITNEKEVTEEIKDEEKRKISLEPNIELSNPGISSSPNRSNDVCISNKCDKMIIKESNSKSNLEETYNFIEKCNSPLSCVENTSSDNQETSCVLDTYTVETPDQSHKSQSKLSNRKKSKSIDDDESPRIVEIIEDNNMPSENSIIALDTCSDIEWEKTLDLEENNLPEIEEPVTGTLSITTIPLTVAHCEQPKLLSSEDELSLRRYLQTLNLATHPTNSVEIKTEIEQIINSEIRHRLKKKGLAEEAFTQRLGPPRMLDVIDEEGSGESSIHSRRHSYLSDKKSDNDDLEDDVFKPSQQSNFKKITDTQVNNNVRKKPSAEQIPQKCLLVGAKLKEPEICEARGNWTIQTVEKMTGAEVVYLTDSSSSTSSIYDVGDDIETEDETDASIRMITPTIEVTDTENFLKKTFIPTNNRDATNPIKQSANDFTVSKDLMLSNASNQDGNAAMDPSRHEIEVLSTDNIKTNLIVKDINGSEMIHDNLTSDEMTEHKSLNNTESEHKLVKRHYDFDLEMKVLKCELNDAINNLIKEVSDSESANENSKDTLIRQDSSSSVSSSQCTAIYNPNSSLLNELSSNINEESYHNSNELKDGSRQSTEMSHVNDVFEYVTGKPTHNDFDNKARQPKKLRDICVERISSLPYGFKILEELANVSLRLQNMNALTSGFTKEISKNTSNSKIQKSDCAQSTLSFEETTKRLKNHNRHIKNANNILSPPSPPPPPVQPRHSSLKKSKEDHQISEKLSTSYVCLSPSQKMLMEKTNTVVTQENSSPFVDLRKKSVDRKDEIHTECTETINTKPFKSQTGSRLLALICDPAITSNINSRHLNKFSEKQSDSTSKIQIEPTKLYRKYSDQGSGVESSQDVFKPIPPPRPKKLLSSFYESDINTNLAENSFKSMKRERKFFHFSTGNLNKEIEDDISTIQSMHKNYLDVKNRNNEIKRQRRPSLPKDICDQQMEYIRQKEKEVDAEIRRLEEEKLKPLVKKSPRAPMIDKKEIKKETLTKTYGKPYIKDEILWNTHIPEKAKTEKKSSLFSNSQEEILRDKMYSEYRNEIAEREQRKHHKVIKITNSPTSNTKIISKSMSALDVLDSSVNNRIEEEFILKAKERWNKLGIKDPESEDERNNMRNVYREPKVIEHKIKVIEAGEEKDVYKLPSHLQEFVSFTANNKKQESESSAVWRPGASPPAPRGSPSETPSAARSPSAPPPPPPPPPVWTPTASPQAPRKTFRPVHFEDTPPARRKFTSGEQNGCTSGSESEGRLRTSQSAPATGLSALGGTSSSRLPRVQNPTVTLLQKARENQLSRVPSNIHERDPRLPRDRPSPPIGDPVHALRKGYLSEGEVDRSDYVQGGSHKMAEATRKIEGIGPTTKEGMPVALRSEVKDPSRWYKKMYDTIHKNKYDDDYVTIRYKNRQGQPPLRVSSSKSQYAYFDPRSGYLSEPEGGRSRLGSSTWSDAYDSDVTTGPRRRTASVQEDRRDDAFSSYISNNKYSTLASAKASQEVYKNQPGRIENYVPGKSSVVDKEAKQWWDEVMDIFDGWLDDNSPLPPYTTLLARAIQKSQNISSTTSLPQTSPKEKKDITSTILSKSNMARALKESGYESDSTLVFRRREENDAPLSPAERRAAYRDLQAGGEPPLRGFRSPAPPRQETDSAPEPPRRIPHGSYSDTESPSRRYVESDVNIHYRCPVRHDPLPLVPERELARQQAEHMKRLYREQKRNKYLQELQDMQNRRHQDNFMPSQKTVVPLNRYDEAEKLVARALYAFNGQTTRELSFKKGDLINIRRQIDANWYEGEVHGRIGLFPYNYVEILKGDYVHSPKKPMIIEGQARAKFDFTAQTNLELPLKKGEIVVLTRRIDHNWWEGRNGTKTGIFPDSYVTVLQEPSQTNPPGGAAGAEKPGAAPAAHGLANGAARRALQRHSYTPQHNSPALANAPPSTAPLPGYVTKPTQSSLTPSERGYGPPSSAGLDLNNAEPLYVDTNAEAVPYRAMYKYRPQNPDELELQEGDTVYVLEKCDDGWYVGSSQRTGRFGTFPGNYVERI